MTDITPVPPVPSREAVEAIINGLTAMDDEAVAQGDFHSAGICADARYSLRTLLAEVERLTQWDYDSAHDLIQERDQLRAEVERLNLLNTHLDRAATTIGKKCDDLTATVAEQGAALAELREVLKDLRDCAAQDLRHPKPAGLLDFRIDELTIFKRADAALASAQP